MSGVPEANIQFQLHHVLREVISKDKSKFRSIEFTDVKPELNVDGGYADLVVYGKEDGVVKPLIVIETKRKTDKD